MKVTRRIAVIGAILLAALLAIPLRAAVYRIVVVPVTYLIWSLYLLYRIVPQFVWWALIFVAVILMVANSLFSGNYSSHKKPVKIKAPQGPVETLAVWLRKAHSGIYFKWLVANRLGRLAYQIFAGSVTDPAHSGFVTSSKPDWNLPRTVQDYLEAGLYSSFADFPQAAFPLTGSNSTPLDHDLAEIVKALEAHDLK